MIGNNANNLELSFTIPVVADYSVAEQTILQDLPAADIVNNEVSLPISRFYIAYYPDMISTSSQIPSQDAARQIVSTILSDFLYLAVSRKKFHEIRYPSVVYLFLGSA